MLKTLNKCILRSLLFNLFFYRQSMHVLLHICHTKPHILCMYIKVWRETSGHFNVWTLLQFHCLLLKPPALIMEPYIKVDVYRLYCQRWSKLGKEMQTTHKLCTSPNSVKKVVIWKDGRTIALGNTCDAFLTTETISYRCTVVVLKNQCLIYYVFFDNVFFSYQRVILVSRYILYTLTMCCFVFRT